MWTNIVNGRARVWKTDFKKEDYVGTVLLAEDSIWLGRSANAAKAMVNKMKRKKAYIACIIDYNKRADFSVIS